MPHTIPYDPILVANHFDLSKGPNVQKKDKIDAIYYAMLHTM